MLKYTDDMTPFDMTEKPSKQYFFLMPLIWLAAFLDVRKFGLKTDKSGMNGVKPPYLVIATHQGPADYSAAPLAMFPRRAMFVSDMEGFEWYGKWLYRGLGCIGKRRFVSDISVVRNMKYALSKGQAVWVYPESRHSNVGTTAYIPKNLGKLCKLMDVPVVLYTLYGAYLANPFWDELHTRKVPMEGKMKLLFSRDDVRNRTAGEIQEAIEDGLYYDEYEYQALHGIRITEDFRAQGLHMPLYRCIKCGERYKMKSRGDTLECRACGIKYLLREDGLLESADKEAFRIPDWYEWERRLEIKECRNNGLRKAFSVKVEALPSEKGFIDLGEGELVMDENEFILRITGKNDFGAETLHFPHRIRESVQTEYDYRGVKGKGIVLSTRDCCYYIYCDADDFNPTELQFLGEWLYQEANKEAEAVMP
jgi:1-acyl-sn-glycerol-3-phosphate acyltransferase/DNA-directed RNA polymerase subunit RPC12/RpoP